METNTMHLCRVGIYNENIYLQIVRLANRMDILIDNSDIIIKNHIGFIETKHFYLRID